MAFICWKTDRDKRIAIEMPTSDLFIIMWCTCEEELKWIPRKGDKYGHVYWEVIGSLNITWK